MSWPARKKRNRLKILYEDAAIVVIDKPAGLLTIATDKIKTRTAYYELNEYLRRKKPFKSRRGGRREWAFIVHRLDREVSGLMVFAKDYAAKRELQENWKQAEKKYIAVVEGIPKKPSGMIASYLSENKFLKVYSGPKTAEAKYAVTEYKTLRTEGGNAILEICLKTGRKHQIRVHLSDLGHPIVGDKKYGSTANPLGRLGLHASALSFPHPVTKKKMDFKSDPDFV